jgi:hypothetical protein
MNWTHNGNVPVSPHDLSLVIIPYFFICECTVTSASRGSSVSVVSGYGPGDWGSIPGRSKRIFPLASVSRPALGPTQPPVQWVLGVKCGRGVTLTTHHLVSRTWMSRSYTSSHPCASIAVLWDCFTLCIHTYIHIYIYIHTCVVVEFPVYRQRDKLVSWTCQATVVGICYFWSLIAMHISHHIYVIWKAGHCSEPK